MMPNSRQIRKAAVIELRHSLIVLAVGAIILVVAVIIHG